jgi:hypothetical protein
MVIPEDGEELVLPESLVPEPEFAKRDFDFGQGPVVDGVGRPRPRLKPLFLLRFIPLAQPVTERSGNLKADIARDPRVDFLI